MFKKVFIFIFVFATFNISSLSNANPTTELSQEARSSILMDANTGRILYEKNSNEKLPPASITKVMTMLLLMEAIDSGKVKLADKVKISEYAASMGGSQIFLEPGEQMTVLDLLKGIAVVSANDASVAIAELLGDTEEGFVKMMNAKVTELGLKNTRFQNPNGLPVADHYSTAQDIASMSRELLKHKDILKYTSIYQDYLRKDSEKPFWLVNTNKLLKFYDGMDGLKTGFTAEAKYCLAATAQKNGFRLIAVVLGEPDIATRNKEVSVLLDHAFNNYKSYLVYRQGELIAETEVENADPQRIKIRTNQPFSLTLKKNESPTRIEKRITWKKLKAPVKKGEEVGVIELIKDGRVIANLSLQSNINMQEAGLWTMTKRVLKKALFVS